MKIPKRGEKGFTLVELLIVLAILAVLAAVVIPNVTGMMGRGAVQAYDTDAKTIQSGVMAYIIDVRDAGNPDIAGHYLPVGTTITPLLADYPGAKTVQLDYLFKIQLDEDTPDPDNPSNYTVQAAAWADDAWGLFGPINDGTVAQCAIIMPWLVEKQEADPGDPGPYLEMPDSAGGLNFNTDDPGSYTWIVDKDGRVYGIYQRVEGEDWYCGCYGSYP